MSPGRRAAVSAPERPWSEGGTVRVCGGVIRWAAMGPRGGPTLLLLPKLGGWIEDWSGCAPYLADRRRVVALDPPGHGGSAMDGPAPYAQSLVEDTALVKAALEALGIERCDVAGNSLGGCIGVAMAALWPRSVNRLALISASLSASLGRAQTAEQDAHAPPGLYGAGETLEATAANMKRFGGGDPAVILEANRSRRHAGDWVRATERGVGLAGVADYLPRVSAATLLIYGEHGAYRQYEAVARANLRQVETAVIPGAGSFTHQEKPRETADALERFLAG